MTCLLSIVFYQKIPKYQMLIVLSSMTLCTMMSVRAMPVHGHCRPNQPDDVLTFSKNHLCVYKELPLLHNRLMHISASAWIFGSKSNRLTILYLLLRRHWRRALFGPSLHLGFLPTRCALWTIGTNTIWLFGTNTIDFLGQIPSTLNPLLVTRKHAFWKNYMHRQCCNNAQMCINCTLKLHSVFYGLALLAICV